MTFFEVHTEDGRRTGLVESCPRDAAEFTLYHRRTQGAPVGVGRILTVTDSKGRQVARYSVESGDGLCPLPTFEEA